MSIQNLQAEFADVILSGDTRMNDVRPAKNIIIYQNNIYTNLIQTLKNTYPLILKLLGDDFFHVTAKEYSNHYPSRSGNLHDYGEYFSVFLAEYPPVHNLMYLAEVAKFEWACHIVYFSADHALLDVKKLENIAQEQYQELRFTLHPASLLMKFHYPILRIIDLCKGEIEDTININEGGINLLIIRREMDISLVSLALCDFIFLTALQNNSNLSDALQAAIAVDPDFDLNEKLPALISNKTLVDCF